MANSTQDLVDQVVFQSDKLIRKPNDLQLIGRGRSAYVFRPKQKRDIAIKIFFPEFEHLAMQEGDIYHCLKDSSYYPKVYEVGRNYLTMEYIEGHTFYDCLYKGIPITESMIAKVDEALTFARSKGLNPSDIHLRNLILTDEETLKVIDVVRFTQDKQCSQWDDLKRAHEKYYQNKFFKKRLPKSIIELIALYYKKVLVPIRSKEITK